MSDFRYDLTRPVLPGERLLMCTDCGAVVADRGVSAHDRFHTRSDPYRGRQVRPANREDPPHEGRPGE